MAKRRRRGGAKRTITPEQQAKMQGGRRRKKVHEQRMTALREAGVSKEIPMTRTERMLSGVKRRGMSRT